MPRPLGEAPRPQLGARPPKAKGKVQPGLGEPGEKDRQGETFLRVLVEQVSYRDFVQLDDPPLTMKLFLEIRNVAINDRFIGRTDEEVLERTGNTPENLAKIRSHPHFAAIAEAVYRKALELAAVVTIDKLAEMCEPQVGLEMAATALTEPKTKERLEALMQLADRRSAKKGREDEAPRAPMFPEDVVALMRLAMTMQVGAGSSPLEVQGSVLNVPRRRALTPSDEPS